MKRIIGMLALIFTFCLFLPAMAAAADKPPAGFIALAPNKMNWNDAVAYCKEQGGKLPRINNSDSWDGQNPPLRDIPIDGFGYGYRPWSEVGLPKGQYWTGTAYAGSPGYAWIVNNIYGSKVYVDGFGQGSLYRVACVPRTPGR